MTTTRTEQAVDQMDWDNDDDLDTCDDLRPAWLCAELARAPAGVERSFEQLWVDR